MLKSFWHAAGKLVKKAHPAHDSAAGLLLQKTRDGIQTSVYLEIMEKDAQDPLAMVLPAGEFLCRKMDMTPEMDLPDG